MKFVIRPAARQDILNQFLYLIDYGVPHAADRFIDAVDETISKLAKRPHIGAPIAPVESCCVVTELFLRYMA